MKNNSNFQIEKIGYNSRQRKQLDILAVVLDANDEAIDAIAPGIGNHRAALEWAEWRAESIRKDYPAAVRMRIYCGDDEIAVIAFAEPPRTTPASDAPNSCANVRETVENAAIMAGFNTIEQRAASRFVLFYKDDAGAGIKNAKGETLCVEVVKCENPGGPSSLPRVWYKNGWTAAELQTWWSIDVSVRDTAGNWRICYDPQIIWGNRPRIDFKYIKEATPENLTEILAEIIKRFNA